MLRPIVVLVILSFFANIGFAKSYQELILADDSLIKNSISHKCFKKIKKVFSSGQDFKSAELMKYTYSSADYNFASQRIDDLFYHYTNSSEAKSNGEANRADLQFNFLRAQRDHTWYLAEDPLSSDHYGFNQIRVHLRGGYFIVKIDRNAWSINEVIDTLFKSQVGNACRDDLGNKYWANSFLHLLAFEQNDVALIDYYDRRAWFELVSESFVDHIELGQKGAW